MGPDRGAFTPLWVQGAEYPEKGGGWVRGQRRGRRSQEGLCQTLDRRWAGKRWLTDALPGESGQDDQAGDARLGTGGEQLTFCPGAGMGADFHESSTSVASREQMAPPWLGTRGVAQPGGWQSCPWQQLQAPQAMLGSRPLPAAPWVSLVLAQTMTPHVTLTRGLEGAPSEVPVSAEWRCRLH